ncbi:hypothetical protein ACFLT9_00100 [Acidobacteriota bacterium]
MKKTVWIGLIFFFFSFFRVYPQSGRPGIHVFGGISSPTEEHLGSAVVSGFGVNFPINSQFSIGLDYLLWKSSVSSGVGTSGLLEGEVNLSPFLLSIDYLILPEARLSPYLMIGIGYVFSKFKIGNVFTIPEVTISQRLNNGIEFHGGGGLNIKLSESFGIFFDAIFMFRKAGGLTTYNDMNFGISRENFTELLNSMIIRIGFKYFI